MEKYEGIYRYEDEDEPLHYGLIDCETNQFYGPFKTWDDAFDATAKFDSALWEVIDDCGNVRGESGKQNRAGKDKADRELAAKRRNDAAKEMHRRVDERPVLKKAASDMSVEELLRQTKELLTNKDQDL
jgi:hypothetical protein